MNMPPLGQPTRTIRITRRSVAATIGVFALLLTLVVCFQWQRLPNPDRFRVHQRAMQILEFVRAQRGRACTSEGYVLDSEISVSHQRDYQSDFSNPSRIEYLSLYDADRYITTDVFRVFPELRVVSLTSCEIDKGLFAAEHWLQIVSLEADSCRVMSGGTDVSDPQIIRDAALRKAVLRKSVGIDHEFIAMLCACPSLEVLDLSETAIENAAIECFIDMKALRVVGFQHCDIGDEFVRRLISVAPRLREIYLKGTVASEECFDVIRNSGIEIVELSTAQSRRFTQQPELLVGKANREILSEDDALIDWVALQRRWPSLTIQRYAARSKE